MSRTKHVAAGLAALLLLSAPLPALAAKTVTVAPESFVKTFTSNASVYYTESVDEYFEEDQAFLESLEIRKNQSVKEGDLLATFTRKNDMASYNILLMDLDRQKTGYDETRDEWEQSLAEREAALGGIADADERRLEQLRLEKERSEFRQYCFNQENSIADLEDEAEKSGEKMNKTELYADFSGDISYITYTSSGRQVYPWDAIVTLYNPDRMLLCVEDQQGNLRYGMKVDITCGTKTKAEKMQELTGTVIVADNILKTELHTGYAFIKLDEPLNDPSVRMIKVSADTIRVENVLVVPNNAVTMSRGQTFVTVVEDGTEKTRYVSRAMFFGTSAWILQGLEAGQDILIN